MSVSRVRVARRVGFLLVLCAVSALPTRARPGMPAFQSQPNQANDSSSHSSSVSGRIGPEDVVAIPGPLRSFLRMAAISQEAAPAEVLPLLARNVVVSGYQPTGKPTEFLVLLNWYIDQARELRQLAGPGGVIRVTSCADAKPVLEILGYKVRGSTACGPEAALETADSNRAFLTIDSGFPLAELEEDLRTGKTFEMPYGATEVPVLFKTADWVQNKGHANRGVIDSILREPQMARLYWAMSRMDTETAEFLWKTMGKRLAASAAVLDFYGDQIAVRSGKVSVPGGPGSEQSWKDLVGASPHSPAEFIPRLLTRDNGWMAAYFDELSRIAPSQQAYFAAPQNLARFYAALRGRDTSPSPTKHSFRPDEVLFLFEMGLEIEPNGQPHIPGGVDVWKEVMRHKVDSKLVRFWEQKSGAWSTPEQVVEGMIGCSRYTLRDGPTSNFLALANIDRARGADVRLSPETARQLSEKYDLLGDQYPIFAEFHQLDDTSISRYLAAAESLDSISDELTKADALGTFQASVGLWEILARQREIPENNLNESWQKLVSGFDALHSSAQVYDAGRAALAAILSASTGKSFLPQDQLLQVLAAPEQKTTAGQQMRLEIASKMRQAVDDQRLVSLDTLIALGNGLNDVAHGKKDEIESVEAMAGELREFEMPKPIFTTRERTEYAAGLYSNRHIALQMRTDLAKIIKTEQNPQALLEARGLLTPFLRDTLVGLNYAYYEPPGAQMMHNNPLFVRSHDFSGGSYSGEAATAAKQEWRSPRLFGRGWTASGGAHLVGSLADLPYALARVEQDFLVPQHVQSLIWEDLTPALLTSAVVSRWWDVTPDELHAVALYQRAGEEILTSATKSEKLRDEVLDILSNRMMPAREEKLRSALDEGDGEQAIGLMAPAESFYLTAEFHRLYPNDDQAWGASGRELENLFERCPSEVNVQRISDDFGVPHPALSETYARQLMDLKPLPTFMGYSSRLMAESWDSGNLYWARLADEMGYSPIMLNRLVPRLARRMVERTFASHLEDWPAVIRAMRETGDEFRAGKIEALPQKQKSAGL